jgi:pyruvate,water dikinase
MPSYTRDLAAVDRSSTPDVGGKAASLGELARAGLPVPSGFVVVTDAYAAHLDHSGLTGRIGIRLDGLDAADAAAVQRAGDEIRGWIEAAPIPEDVREQLGRSYADLAGEDGVREPALVAVRSSATSEDSASASFAGQHDTFLGVLGEDKVADRVRECWASLWTPQAVAYRIRQGFDHLDTRIAVVVQTMVDADAAGVAFTANPVTGNRDELLVSAGYGLGEAIVSGLITPDTYTLTRDGRAVQRVVGSKKVRVRIVPGGTTEEPVSAARQQASCLQDDELARLAELATRVEQHFGRPQDIEWALAGGKLFLLQSRPITTLRDTDPDANARTASTTPRPSMRSGLLWKLVIWRFPEPPTPLDTAYLSARAGGVVAPTENADGSPSLRPGGPRQLLGLAARFASMFFRGLVTGMDVSWARLRADTEAWLANTERRLDTATKPAALIDHLATALTGFGDLFERRIGILASPGFVAELTLDHGSRRRLGDEAASALEEDLIKAVPFPTARQNRQLVALARTATAWGTDSGEFASALNDFLADYGARTSDATLPSSVTWREDPRPVRSMVASLVHDGAFSQAETEADRQELAYLAARRHAEEFLTPAEWHRLEKSLARARRGILIREESAFGVDRMTALLRSIALRLGDALAGRGVIERPDDVFFLFLEELPSAVAAGDVMQKVRRRRAANVRIHAAYREGIPWPVATGAVPADATAANAPAGPSDSVTFTGVPASRGIREGTVCIVRGPDEFGKLKKGDVMVSVSTSPSWTPLFRVASAVVTEIGSPTSHAAIVAREYDLPAIVAVERITSRLTDGQRVRVDGARGTVTVIA